MFRTLLISTFRNLRKNPVFSLINLLGFTLGIASFILIMLFIVSELSYDRYNEKADRIYRLCIRATIGETKINQTYSFSRIFGEMKERYPEIENGVKLIKGSDVYVRVGERNFTEPAVLFADSTVFDVFTIPLVSGSPATALNRPNTIVISEKTARRYFGDMDPLGRVIRIDLNGPGAHTYEVTGVFREIPVNTHLHFDLLASLVTFPEFLGSTEWTANNFITYFVLKPGASAKDLQAKFESYILETFGSEKYEAFKNKGNSWEFFLQPLTSIHLHSDLNGEFEPNGNIRYVYIFSVIAFFVLIIACINFMNLSTAKSTLRAREVGIKKTAGSSRGELIRQFLAESVILTFISLILAILLAKLVLPAYSQWLGRSLTLDLLSNYWIIPGLLLFGCTIGVLAGIYPAFFMSSYQPTRVLKTQVITETKGIGLRNLLVIFQFAASIFLIIGTLVIKSQLHYIQSRDVGFSKENILILRTPGDFAPLSRAFEDEVRQHPAVVGMTASTTLPGFSFSNRGFGAEGTDKWFTLNIIACDTGFGRAMELTVIEGRFFSPDFPTDSSGIVLNETAVRMLGLKDPIGTKMFDGSTPRRNYHVIGVVRDFNYESLHAMIRPMGLVNLNRATGSYMSIRYEQGKTVEITRAVEQIWKKLLPGIPISYSYMEEDYRNLYRNEIQTSQVFTLLAGLAIIVAILGLLGLASFMVQRRVREIAIRKISGAGVGQIIRLLTWKFIRWVMISFMVACPVAWWVMERWLEHFAYRVSLNGWIFVLSGAIAIVLVIMTVGMITFRTAMANPAGSLKYE